MKRRWKLWVALAVLFGSLVALPAVHWRVIGWAQGEAFYQGRPTSWWSSEIEDSYHERLILWSGLGRLPEVLPNLPDWWVDTPSSLWVRMRQQLKSGNTAIPVMDVSNNSPLLNGDPTVLPLLLALVRSQSAKVRRVAISGLFAQGKQTPEVVPALLQLLDDPEDEVRRDALIALRQLDPEAAAKTGIGEPAP